MPDPTSDAVARQPASWMSAVRAALLGALLVVVMTAPTLTRATSVGRLDTDDGRFSIWNIAWVGHALMTDPGGLLDANIFYPHTGTLAYSELNLVAGVLGLPAYAVTGDPLAALNWAIGLALWITFMLTWHLVRRLTGSDGAGLVAATAFTFCPYMSARTAHVQLLMTFVFPLVMIAFHRFSERPGVPRGAQLGGALAVAALTCGYYGLFAGCMLGLVSIVAARRSSLYWVGLAIAVATTAVVVYPVFSTYVEARAASGAELRPWAPSDARIYSANLSAYLASSAFTHEWWLPILGAWMPWKDVLFPGVLLLALAAGGVWIARRQPQVRPVILMYGVLAAMAAWASFGPDGWLYLAMHYLIPGMSMLRAPARLGIVVAFALSVIAGFAVARLERRWTLAPAAIVCLLVVELGVYTPQWGWPSWPLRERLPLSPAYQRLAQLPRGVLLEFPFPYVSANFHNHAAPMFWSSYHWQPLVNGYSDLIPPDFYEIALPINAFPDAASFEIARSRQVRYVLWHLDRYDERARAVLMQRLATYEDYFQPLVRTDDVWLFEIVKWPS